MKKITLLLLIISTISLGQKKVEVYKKLANFTCDCAKSKGSENLTDVAVGLCIFESLNKINVKEQKIIGYNSEKKAELSDEIAENIGTEMAFICPEVFSNLESQEGQSEEVDLDLYFTGNYSATASNEFNTIKVLDENKLQKDFIWLFPFDGDALLMKKKINVGEKIEVRYREQSFFDPKTNAYKIFNEILEIKLL